jgi:manganese transport protein
MAILLQSLCIRLGIVTKLDLAQHCSLYFSKHVGMALYVLAEVGIIAMDLAEVIGSAIALKLLLGIPILYGVLITSLDVMVILLLWSSKETRPFEILIFVLVMSVAICLFVIVGLSGVDFSKVALGFLPPTEIISNPNALLITIGIIGATGFNFITLVMPHNLYLHSNLVIRKAEQSQNIKDKSNYYKVVRTMLNLSYMDSAVALMFALFVNAAILIVSAANFNSKGRFDIADLEDAYYLMQSTLGSSASTLFAVALLLAGQSSTITGTLAGQIVMEAFLPNLKLRPWMRRLVTRSLAIVPAIVTIFIYGDQGLTNLLIYSQVVLSLQLPFAVW